MKWIELISPNTSAKICYYSLSHPKKTKLREEEIMILKNASRHFENIRGHNVCFYQWGNGKKKALLVHGWEGRTSNFGRIINELVKTNYTVFGFDAPGHAMSQNRKVSFFDYSDVLEEKLRNYHYDLIVTHSMGSIIALYVMNKIKYSGKNMILFSCPDKFEDYIQYSIKRFGLNHKTTSKLIKLIRKKTGIDPSILNGSDFVKNIVLNKAVFIHDKYDRVVPISWTRNVQINMKNSIFYTFQKTGHFKMLWSNETINLLRNVL